MSIKERIAGRTFEYLPVILLLLMAVMALPLITMGRYTVAVMLLLAPLFLVLAVGPRPLLYLYVATMTFNIYPVPGLTMLVADYVLVGLILAAAIDFLVNVRRDIAIPRLTGSYLFFIAVMIVSGLAAYSPTHSLTPILRAILQMTVLVMFYNYMNRDDIEKLPKLFFWVMVIQAAMITLSFISLGGITRVFGIARNSSDDLMMLAFAVGLAYAVWSVSASQSRLYGLGTIIILAGLLSTQSRFPAFTVVWVGLVILIYSWFYAGKLGFYPARRRIRAGVFASGVFVILLLTGYTIFSGIVSRFDSVFSKNMGGSVLMRYSLWKTALVAFLENPVLGIGPGNFRFVDAAVPSVKFVVIRHVVRGLSAHNMVLHYLAETGILGVTALVWLYARYFGVALQGIRTKLSEFPMTIRMTLFGVALTAVGEIFYMDGWMWGVTAFPVPLFMALTCRMLKENHAD